MNEREALKMALEALEEIALAGMSPSPEMIDNKEAFHAHQAWRFIGIAARALEPIKEALAQQSNEQVDTIDYKTLWQEMCERCDELDSKLAEQKQEPVAWFEQGQSGHWFLAYNFNPYAKTRPLVFGDTHPPVPTAQPKEPEQEPDDLTIAYMAGFSRGKDSAPQRTWVGLTEQEAAECWSTSTVRTWQAIEAKLKEKNGC